MVVALGRQRQADLCEFEVSLVYKVSGKPRPRLLHRETLSQKTNKQKKEKKKN